jgi:hypothetical protein
VQSAEALPRLFEWIMLLLALADRRSAAHYTSNRPPTTSGRANGTESILYRM